MAKQITKPKCKIKIFYLASHLIPFLAIQFSYQSNIQQYFISFSFPLLCFNIQDLNKTYAKEEECDIKEQRRDGRWSKLHVKRTLQNVSGTHDKHLTESNIENCLKQSFPKQTFKFICKWQLNLSLNGPCYTVDLQRLKCSYSTECKRGTQCFFNLFDYAFSRVQIPVNEITRTP